MTPEHEKPSPVSLPEEQRPDEALRQAVREAIVRHRRSGNSVAVWRQDQVVWISPDEMQSLSF